LPQILNAFCGEQTGRTRIHRECQAAALRTAPLLQIDNGRLFNQLPVWAPDENVRKTILVENACKTIRL